MFFLYCAFIALIPTAVALIFYLVDRERQEFLISIAVCFVASFAISLGSFYAVRSSKILDTEILNGFVTGRQSNRVSCEHSYQICTSSGKNQTCTTYYEHEYDIDWDVYSTVGTTTIQRIDSQGLLQPPRWSQVYIGEPFSREHNYDNYMLMDLGSVMFGQKGDVNRFKALLPQYPKVTDYYRLNHVIIENVPMTTDNVKNWQNFTNDLNVKLGHKKQVNILIVLVNTADPNYVYALQTYWKNGKKNDAIIVLGSTDGHKIEFAKTITWQTNGDFKVNIENDLMDIGNLDRRDLIYAAVYKDIDTYFTRLHMKNYHYMVNDFSPSTTSLLLITLLETILSVVGNIILFNKLENNF